MRLTDNKFQKHSQVEFISRATCFEERDFSTPTIDAFFFVRMEVNLTEIKTTDTQVNSNCPIQRKFFFHKIQWTEVDREIESTIVRRDHLTMY